MYENDVRVGVSAAAEEAKMAMPTTSAKLMILDRFIGAIIIGNGVGALWLSTEKEWARVRPLALVALVYGTLVAVALLYHLLWLNASSAFWIYFLFDVPFLLVYYALFIYHDIIPRLSKQKAKPGIAIVDDQKT